MSGGSPRSRPLRCRLGWHAPRKGALWNRGYYFTECARCHAYLIRTAFSGWEEPRGYRVVWPSRSAGDEEEEGEAAERIADKPPRPSLSIDRSPLSVQARRTSNQPAPAEPELQPRAPAPAPPTARPARAARPGTAPSVIALPPPIDESPSPPPAPQVAAPPPPPEIEAATSPQSREPIAALVERLEAVRRTATGPSHEPLLPPAAAQMKSVPRPPAATQAAPDAPPAPRPSLQHRTASSPQSSPARSRRSAIPDFMDDPPPTPEPERPNPRPRPAAVAPPSRLKGLAD